MLKKTVRQMLIAQIFSSLTVSLCLLIDNIIIGRHLGVGAIAAYGLANPVLLLLGAIASMLSAGVQVACSKSLGRGDQDGTNEGYSSAVALTILISVPFTLLVLLLQSPLATALGAGTEGTLFNDTRDYLRGFVIGAPASMGALILVPFLQIAGKSTLLIAAVGGMTLGDIALDLLNVYVFKGGMFGMGLASSLSYYIALIIGLFYFLSKKCIFKFSLKNIHWKKIGELFKSGLPSVFSMASIVILTFGVNNILLGLPDGGSDGVAAFSVITTIGNSANCITTGIGGVALTMMSILYQEQDRSGMESVIKQLCIQALLLGALVGGALIGAAPLIVKLFIPNPGEAQELTVFGIRLFALGLIPSCLCGALKNTYQAIGHPVYTEIISLAEGALFPTLIAWILSFPLQARGVFFYFFLGELTALISLVIFCWIKNRRWPFPNMGMLLLNRDFSVPKEDIFQVTLSTIEEVTAASEQVMKFCLERGASQKAAYRISLSVEEMGSNSVLHGFNKDNKKHVMSILVMYKENSWLLRFRDDCRAFDPIHYVPKKNKTDHLGIRMILALADDAKYTYSLSMNNLAITIREHSLEETDPEPAIPVEA
ncbi:MAG: ATP-binding protein [Clostridia bacterium]|nr:ATP-binding protein [Clostridia bacterium]